MEIFYTKNRCHTHKCKIKYKFSIKSKLLYISIIVKETSLKVNIKIIGSPFLRVWLLLPQLLILSYPKIWKSYKRNINNKNPHKMVCLNTCSFLLILARDLYCLPIQSIVVFASENHNKTGKERWKKIIEAKQNVTYERISQFQRSIIYIFSHSISICLFSTFRVLHLFCGITHQLNPFFSFQFC